MIISAVVMHPKSVTIRMISSRSTSRLLGTESDSVLVVAFIVVILSAYSSVVVDAVIVLDVNDYNDHS